MAKVLGARCKVGDIFMSELYHHGILGMKWGVRRTPEQLGHKMVSSRKVERYAKKRC